MTLLASLRTASPPAAALAIAADRVSAASIDMRGGHAVVVAHATEPLPAGAIVPSLTAANVHDTEAAAAAVSRALEQIGRPKRVGLIVSDTVARVSLLKFERIPPRAQDLDQLVRWQMKKAAPFPIEEAQVTYVPGWRAPDGQEFVVAAAKRDVIAEYEALCAAAGAHAGLVDLATFNVANAVLADRGASGGDAPAGADWLLVNVAIDYASIAILRGEHLIFFRSRTADADGTLADLVHQTAMYYEDRLSGTGFGRVILAGAATSGQGEVVADIEQARRSLQERVGTAVEFVDPRGAAAIADRISASPALLDTLAPLVGLLVRGREVAV